MENVVSTTKTSSTGAAAAQGRVTDSTGQVHQLNLAANSYRVGGSSIEAGWFWLSASKSEPTIDAAGSGKFTFTEIDSVQASVTATETAADGSALTYTLSVLKGPGDAPGFYSGPATLAWQSGSGAQQSAPVTGKCFIQVE